MNFIKNEGDKNRTCVIGFGNQGSTIELRLLSL
jgi:hypothetical protein